VRSILSLEPPSDANPACISTAMASTTCLNLPTLVSHPSSSSLTTFATFFHFLRLFTLRPTTTAATAHVATATVTATPTTTLPISPDQPNYILPHSPPIAHHHPQTPPFQHARNETPTNRRPQTRLLPGEALPVAGDWDAVVLRRNAPEKESERVRERRRLGTQWFGIRMCWNGRRTDMETFISSTKWQICPPTSFDISDLSRYLFAIFLPFMTDFEVNDNFDFCYSFSLFLFLRFFHPIQINTLYFSFYSSFLIYYTLN